MTPTDKERLNFLRDYAWGVAMNFDKKKKGRFKCHVGGGSDGYGETPRQAIDASIRAEKRES